ncbi:uncharacterized protein (DUF924 family) [Chromohalobacter marismortui]|uniref:Uncharacterized protein (DUF924 family) n=1 Tax=Chromohalobacter marismortui TaxID=42055 RepID=A0A4R7NG81_9GAMM|nr:MULTISPECIES: DUF924 family protein [Chromohalobacter]MCI0509446.1 DUF924 domain-containing protein [Chromohalobacter sp.]MCI0593067.1 DUF924 domain-containing protein [Chromohalobacter sp.]TDU19319.1 uncharacterized protein (DUF924 family) [Chromohalobacter marismortui]
MTQDFEQARQVLDFWFVEAGPKQWFNKSASFDQALTERFGALHDAACRCELYAWRQSSHGALAEILLLDQFSRNIYRDQASAFAQDPLALSLAQHLVAQGGDQELPPEQRAFVYMPYMHSESPLIHQEALRLFDQPGLERHLDFEQRHWAIIERFGRYPHRNAILGRESTPEERDFLRQPGSSF